MRPRGGPKPIIPVGTIAKHVERLRDMEPVMTRNATPLGCETCKDTAFACITDARGVVYSQPCPDCDKGRQILDGEKRRRLKREQRRKIEAVKDAAESDGISEDDLPF